MPESKFDQSPEGQKFAKSFMEGMRENYLEEKKAHEAFLKLSPEEKIKALLEKHGLCWMRLRGGLYVGTLYYWRDNGGITSDVLEAAVRPSSQPSDVPIWRVEKRDGPAIKGWYAWKYMPKDFDRLPHEVDPLYLVFRSAHQAKTYCAERAGAELRCIEAWGP